jgi:hypothetical protein
MRPASSQVDPAQLRRRVLDALDLLWLPARPVEELGPLLETAHQHPVDSEALRQLLDQERADFAAGRRRPVWLCLGIGPDLRGDPGALSAPGRGAGPVCPQGHRGPRLWRTGPRRRAARLGRHQSGRRRRGLAAGRRVEHQRASPALLPPSGLHLRPHCRAAAQSVRALFQRPAQHVPRPRLHEDRAAAEPPPRS